MLDLETAHLVARWIEGYLGLGLLFGLLVALVPVLGARVDRGLAASGGGVRFLLVPGFTLLWPWLVLRTLRGDGQPPNESNAHRRASAPP